MIVAPSRLGCVAPKIDARDMMEVAKLGAAHAAEKVLRAVRASAVFAVGFLMIDALDWKLAARLFQELASSAISSVPLFTRERMNVVD